MAAFLQGFLNFCAGCFVFGYLMKFGLVSEAVYRMHVNTRCVVGEALACHLRQVDVAFSPQTRPPIHPISPSRRW